MNAPVTVYVPRDSAATSVGADEVADELLRAAVRIGRPIRVIRNGSRGMLWLEPLVEVVTPEGRIGYGPVTPGAVDDLVAAGLLDGADHPSRVGVVEDLPWLATQDRVTFARVGVTDPLSANDYLSRGRSEQGCTARARRRSSSAYGRNLSVSGISEASAA